MHKHSISCKHLFSVLALILLLTVPGAAAASGAETADTAKEAQAESDTKPAVKPAGKIQRVSGAWYLYDVSTGKPVTGRSGVIEFPAGSGVKYFLKDSTGKVYVKTWIKAGSDVYRADKTGKLLSGFSQVSQKTYYFDPKTNIRAKAGWKKIADNWYYFSKKGIPGKGFKTINSKTYYLNPAANGQRAVGWKQISRKWYYFNKKGVMKTGVVNVDGKYYFLNQKGIRKYGLRRYNGSTYYFSKNKGGAAATGWYTYKSRKYYFSSTGKAVTGWLTLSGKKYYFNSNGVMQKGWVTLSGKKYYFSTSNGAMFTGKHTIDGKTYDFGSNGYLAEPTGPWSIKVNQGTCVVTVYRGDTPVKAMLCSVGVGGATPNGTFYLGAKRHWHELFGSVWGQYTTVITGNILFHSVYYYRYRDNNSLATAEFNKLGSPASHGCVRLSCADAYYIYTNCPTGPKVTIFSGSSADDPLGRPSKLTISTSYDPTDPITGD